MIVQSPGTKSGRENFCMVLTVLSQKKGALMAYKQSSCCDMTNMNGKKHRTEVVPANNRSPVLLRLCLTVLGIAYSSMGIKCCMKKKKTFPFVLCVSLMTLFMTTREEMF